MFDPKTGIEVRVKPYGSSDPYHEWTANTKSKLHAAGRNEVYIEAVTDERFEIEVILHALFPWGKASNVAVHYNIDSVITNSELLKRPKERSAVTSRSMDYVNYVNGVRKLCGFTFAEVETVDDDTFLSGEEEDAELSRRGKIQVTLQRVKAKERKQTKKERWEMEDEEMESKELSGVTNKVVSIDNGRSHYAQQLVLHSLAERKSSRNDTVSEWIPAKDDGQKIVFTI